MRGRKKHDLTALSRLGDVRGISWAFSSLPLSHFLVRSFREQSQWGCPPPPREIHTWHCSAQKVEANTMASPFLGKKQAQACLFCAASVDTLPFSPLCTHRHTGSHHPHQVGQAEGIVRRLYVAMQSLELRPPECWVKTVTTAPRCLLFALLLASQVGATAVGETRQGRARGRGSGCKRPPATSSPQDA